MTEEQIAKTLNIPFDELHLIAKTRLGLRLLLSYTINTAHLKGLQKAHEHYNALFRGEEEA